MIHHIRHHTNRLVQNHKHLYREHKGHLALHTFLALITGLALHFVFPVSHSQTIASHDTTPIAIEHYAADTTSSLIDQTLMDVVAQLDTGIEIGTDTTIPHVSLKIQPDSHDGVNVLVGTDEFTFRPKLAGKQNTTVQDGHIMVYINDQYYTKTYSSSFHIPSHHYDQYDSPVVVAMLVSNDHTPLLVQGDIIYDAELIE